MEEISDSNCENTCHRVNDSCAYSHKYKGVVPQQNGNWGAQIYTNNQRIWIGTFRTELDAAIAYDRASIVLRSSDAPRNFPWNKTTVQEAEFQSLYSKDKILALIKEGSYQSKFDDFLRQRTEKENANDISLQKSCGFSPRPLFEKVLTPSDVGKLNRLVIPKKYAVSYFPPIPENDQSPRNDDGDLRFFDVQNRLWKFRYCYWKSSQSFVFTRGWNQFVKEKRLMANDTISFYYLRNPHMPGSWIIETPSDTEASLKLGLRRKRREEEGSVDDHEMSSKLGLEWKRQKKEEEGSVDDHEMSLKLGLRRKRREEEGSVDDHEMSSKLGLEWKRQKKEEEGSVDDHEMSLKLGLRRKRREEEGSVDDHEMSSKLGLEWKRQKKEEEGSVDDHEMSLKLGLGRKRREEEGSVDEHEMGSKLGLEWKRQKKEEEGSVDDHEMSLKLGLGRNRRNKEEDESDDNHERKDEVIQTSNVKTKGFKLFGVEIGMAS